jgi:fused signal recognition particle receptor
MSGMGMQLAILVGILVLLILIVTALRRASERSQKNAPRSVQERLGVGREHDEAAKPRRHREKPRPAGAARPAKQDAKPEPKKKRPEPEERDDDEDDDDEAEDKRPTKAAKGAEPDPESAAAYRDGLAKTRGGFVAKLGKLFGKKKIDAGLLEELEQVLFTADIGPRAADRIFQAVKTGLSKDDLEDADKVWAKIRSTSNEILALDAAPPDFTKRPLVILTIGVNGVGKTTTIGKLAAKLTREGKQVLLAAGDTFRAAATEQLEEWGKRAGVPVVKGKSGQDPSSVIFEAVKRGVDEKLDVVICDTAGRLHSNAALMDELKKVRRVCDKASPGAPHETWMVLDATNGQNAISQAKTFKAEMEITGIVLTKLDGTSKGGVILGICDELKVPIRFIGVGERVDDLRPFDPAWFVDALYKDAAGPDAAA